MSFPSSHLESFASDADVEGSNPFALPAALFYQGKHEDSEAGGRGERPVLVFTVSRA